jgi:hypothetical protein
MFPLNLKVLKGNQVTVRSYRDTAKEGLGPAQSSQVHGDSPSHLSWPDRDLQAETSSSTVSWDEVTSQRSRSGLNVPSPPPPP